MNTPDRQAREQQRRLKHTQDLKRRDEIIELVRGGQMRPDEADRIALDESLPPFIGSPDPAEFMVSAMASWSIEMVLAWIVWRDMEWVLKFHNPFRSQVTYWKPIFLGNKLAGFEIDVRGRANLSNLAFLSGLTYESSPLTDAEKGEKLLWQRLEEGRLTARAVDTDSFRVKQIPNYEWSYLVVANRRASTELRVEAAWKVLYRDIKFDRAEVMQIWPETKHSAEIAGSAGLKKGRPPKYDWPTFRAEALRKLDDEGDFDVAVDPSWNQAALERHMIDWCEKRWPGEAQPSESTVRREVSKTRNTFQKARAQSEGQ